jgi:hypothetical protein
MTKVREVDMDISIENTLERKKGKRQEIAWHV